MSKARDLANLISQGNPLSDGAISVSEISDLTASAAELNKLDGVTASTAELNQVVGATSALQTQLDNISVTSGSLTKTFTQNETADITLSQGITSAPVVSATKEIPQTGFSTKGSWDVNSTASNYTIHNTAYSVTLTPNKSALTMTLGSGSWASTDVGKRVQGNGGDVVIASVSGSTATYFTDNGTDFTDNSAIASGSWSMEGLMSVDDATGLSVQKRSRTISTTTNAYGTTFRLNSYTQSYSHSGNANNPVGLAVARNGGYFYICKQSQGVKIYSTSGSFNISNANYVGSFNIQGYGNYDVELNDTGTKIYQYIGYNYVKQYPITGTAWRPDTGTGTSSSYTLTGGQTDGTPSEGGAMQFADSGKVLYLLPPTDKSGNQNENSFNKVRTTQGSVPHYTGVLYYFTLSTAYELSTATYQGYKRVPFYSYATFGVSEDGKWLVNGAYNEYHAFYYSIPTAFDITTINAANETYIDYRTYNGNQVSHGMIGTHFVGQNYYATSYNSNTLLKLPWGPSFGPVTSSTTENLNPQNIYNVAVTNTSGQIDSSNFIDINSMTADENVGSATGAAALYAVSTDDRTTWSVAKGTDGVRPIVRNNSGTWQYNSAESSFGISTASYTGKSFNVNSQEPNATGVFFKPDGTKMYVNGYSNDDVNEYNLSTAWDITTATYSQNFNLSSQDTMSSDIFFRSDGLRFWMVGTNSDKVREYYISTAWDISTAAYVRDTALPSGQQNPQGIFFKSDGTKMYVAADNGSAFNILEYTLSSGWNVATATYVQAYTITQDSNAQGVWLNNDGTKMFVLGDANRSVFEYNLSTAYDVSTASYSNNSFSVNSQLTGPRGLFFKPDGSNMYVVGADNNLVVEYNTLSYGTSATWTNGTVNDELYTLQQALSVGTNRMDKTQLDAVADANHFATGTKLDLMIALRVDEATTSVPTSDGVTLNYDAAALNEGAVLGTDYDFFFPSSTKVQIKSLAAQNLKVRVV